MSEYSGFFTQADAFIADVRKIELIRKSLAPHTKTDIDEIGLLHSLLITFTDMRMTGVILPDDNVENPVPIPEPYWNAAGGMYAYLVGQLSLLGIDVLGESQLVGYPTQV